MYIAESLLDFDEVHKTALQQYLGRAEPGYEYYTSYKGDDHLNCKTNDTRSH